MGNWLVNHWFSAAVLVSVWGWGGSSAWRGWGDAGGYGGHSLGMAPGGSWGKWGLICCPGAGLWGRQAAPLLSQPAKPWHPGRDGVQKT